MKQSGFLAKLVITIFILIIISQVVFVSIYSLPSQKSVISERISDIKDIESIKTDNSEKTNGKSVNYFNVCNSSQAEDLKNYSRISNLYIENMDTSSLKDLSKIDIHSITLENVGGFDLSLINPRFLNSITLNNTKIDDYSYLSSIKNLTHLTISGGEIKNKDFFNKLTNLKSLVIYDIDLDDISFLEKMQKLELLSLDFCNISHISPVSNLKKLKVLSLRSNNITDISPISSLSDLNSISLSNNKIKGLADFSKIPYPNYIDMSFNNVNEIKLSENSRNFHLDLSYNNIDTIDDDIIHLVRNSNISINLFGNKISNASNLKDISGITYKNQKGEMLTYNQHTEYLNALDNFSKTYVSQDWSQLKKAVVIFLVLSKNTEYFYDYNISKSDTSTYSHTEYGTLINKKAVCDGLAFAYRDLLNIHGIKSHIYYGDVNSQADDATHIWNVVYIDSKPYHCDLTTGVISEKNVSDIKYYNISNYLKSILYTFGASDNQLISKNYFLQDKSAPKCADFISESAISNVVYELIEGEEKYFFVEKEKSENQGGNKDEKK